jgi:hypothetical protein
MTPLVIALVLAAALLHASWNAILRGGEDRLWSITVMCAVSVVVAAPFLLLLPAPARASWPCLGFSSAPQIGYCFFSCAPTPTADLLRSIRWRVGRRRCS